MKPCFKKVTLGFGAVLLAVILFVPYRSVHVSSARLDPGSVLIKRTMTAGRGFMFLPRFLRLSSRPGSADRDTFRLDAARYAGHIAAVLVLAAVDYFLLCPKGRPRKPGQGF